MKQIRWFAMLCMCGAVGWAIGCSDDEPAGGGTGGAGGSRDGGTGGSSGSGGSATSGGSGGGSGAAGAAGGDAGRSALNPRSIAVVTAPEADATAPTPHLLAAGTDFIAKTEVSVVDIGGASVIERTTFDDGDAVPAASGGIGFVLERTNDRVHVVDTDGSVARTVDMHAAPTAAAVRGRKAYVLLYATNRIAVVDVDAGEIAKHIDVSEFHASGDSDGAVDMDDVLFDPATNRAYVTLGRIDRNTIQAPNFELACPSWNALVVAIDTTTDAVIDLNGAAAGNAAELSFTSPAGIHLDTAQNRLVVLSSGCMLAGDGGGDRTRHGIEAIDLASGAVTALLTPSNDDFLSRLLLIGGGEALVNSFDALYTEQWHRFTLSANTLGTELADVPSAPSFDGEGALLGIRFGTSAEVVRYQIDTGNVTTLVSAPWTGTYTSAGGTALVR